MALDPEFLLSITLLLENVPFPEKFSILTVSPQMAPPATKVGLLLDPSVWFSSSGLSASSSAASDSESSEVESVSLEDTTVSVELRIATREDAVA